MLSYPAHFLRNSNQSKCHSSAIPEAIILEATHTIGAVLEYLGYRNTTSAEKPHNGFVNVLFSSFSIGMFFTCPQ